MKHNRILPLLLLTGAVLAPTSGRAAAPGDDDAIAVVRSVIKADRQATVAQALQLTDTEAAAFWPLYHQYRAEMDTVADGLLDLVKEYAGYYPNVSEDQAGKMLKDLGKLEKKKVAARARWLKKTGKVLPADKNLRFAQVENRLDLALQLELAAKIPFVPIQGRLTGEAAAAAVIEPGVPGGAVVKTHVLVATVIAVEKASREVTLISPDGIKETFKAGPEVVNFGQIRVGDRLKITATEQLVVYVAGKGESPGDGAAEVAVLAPQGAKPGGLMADITQVTATVKALDTAQHTATLQFADGTTRTVPVRPDVDLSQRKVGDQVVISITESLAIKMEQP